MILKYLLIAGALVVLWFMIRSRLRVTVVDDIVKAISRIKTPPVPVPPPRLETLVKCAKCGAYGPAGKPCICAGG